IDTKATYSPKEKSSCLCLIKFYYTISYLCYTKKPVYAQANSVISYNKEDISAKFKTLLMKRVTYMPSATEPPPLRCLPAFVCFNLTLAYHFFVSRREREWREFTQILLHSKSVQTYEASSALQST